MPGDDEKHIPTREEAERKLKEYGLLGMAKVWAVYGIKDELKDPKSFVVETAIRGHPSVVAYVAGEDKSYAARVLEELVKKGVAPDYEKERKALEARSKGIQEEHDKLEKQMKEVADSNKAMEEERQSLRAYKESLEAEKSALKNGERDFEQKLKEYRIRKDRLEKVEKLVHEKEQLASEKAELEKQMKEIEKQREERAKQEEELSGSLGELFKKIEGLNEQLRYKK